MTRLMVIYIKCDYFVLVLEPWPFTRLTHINIDLAIQKRPIDQRDI